MRMVMMTNDNINDNDQSLVNCIIIALYLANCISILPNYLIMINLREI